MVKKKRKKRYSVVGTGLAGVMLCTSVVPATAAEQGTDTVLESPTKVVSHMYRDLDKWNLNWREAMVSGNGENGVMTTGHPTNDAFIFQNTTFNMPTDDYRETPDLTGELEGARQAVINNQEWYSSAWPELDYDYTLHPGHQLRVKMGNAKENNIENYERWTDYEKAEVGVEFTENGNTWTRTTFTSREDNVTITRLGDSEEGEKLDITLSVDDLSDMAIDQGKEIDSGLQYKKFADENGDYLGLVAHYPSYEESELKEGGFAGVTTVLNVGGTKERVELGEVTDYLHVGDDTEYGVRIEDAEEVILITRSARDKEMGTKEEFESTTSYDVVEELVQGIEEVAQDTDYQTRGNFDYDKAMEPHAKLHGEEFNRVKFDLEGDIEDGSLVNEDLIEKQRGESRLNHAMMERAFYAGRYAQICASGYSTSRLSGMWMGCWNGYWQADYTTDANVNLQISGVNIGNLPQSAEGYINFILRLLPDTEMNAERVYGMKDAIMFPPRTDGDRANIVHFNKDYPFNYWNAGASWLLYPIYEYWQCYGNQQIPIGKDIDLSALKSVLSVEDQDLTDAQIQKIQERGYFELEKDLLLPLLTKQANFWEQLVDPRYYMDENGYKQYDAEKTSLEPGESYLILPGYSPENKPSNTWIAITANATMDIAAARSGLDMVIAMEKTVKRTGYEEAVLKWESLKEQLPGYMYDSDGSLKEWALRDYSEQNNHRHVSHMYGIWPSHEGDDEKLVDGAKKALENRKKYNTGDDNASHGWLHQALTEARLKNADGVTECLMKLFTGSKLYYSSMMTNHDRNRDSAYCTDALITIPSIMLESLAYSDTGEIQLLPSLPEGWDAGSVSGVMARTGAEIETLSWDLENKEVYAKIRSDREQTLKVSCYKNSSSVEILSGEGEVDTKEGIVSLSMQEGDTAEIRFQLSDMETGTYKLVSEEGSLDVQNAEENSPVVLHRDFQGDLSQKWNLEGTGIGMYKLVNGETGKELKAVDNIPVQAVEGDIWCLEPQGEGYGILNTDKSLALGVTDGNLVLTDVENALQFTLEKQDNVNVPEAVKSIKIMGTENLISGETVQLEAEVETKNGIFNGEELYWSVKNMDGEASVTRDGVFTAQKAGKVIVQVWTKNKPANVQEKEVTIGEGMMEQELLAGEVIGRQEGQWEQANPPANAFDGDTDTMYDGEDGGYAGVSLPGQFYLTGVRYVGRAGGYEERLDGALIQGSNDGDIWETICEIDRGYNNPVYNAVMTECETPYSQYRIKSGASGFCNVAEIEFYGYTEDAGARLENILLVAERLNEEDYEAEGIEFLKKEMEKAKALTESASEAEIERAAENVFKAIRDLKKPYLIYHYDTSAVKNGNWNIWEDDRTYAGCELYSKEAGSSFTVEFEGTGFEMLSNKNPGLGYIRILVDGESVEGSEEILMYDSHWEGYNRQSIFKYTGLEDGIHEVTVELLDKQNPDGKNPKMSLDAFRIFRDSERKDTEPEPPVQEADTNALEIAVTMAEKLEGEQEKYTVYTEATWSAVQNALDNARILLDNPEATQEEIDASFLELMKAVNLLESDVQKAGLGAVIEGAKAILSNESTLAGYTPDSVETVRAALEKAEAIYADNEATQISVNEAATNLMTAVNNLLVVEADKRLDILIQKAEELLQKEDQYTNDSVQVLKDALEEAKKVAADKNATEQEINDTYNALAEAMASLVRVANKAELENVLNKANEILTNTGKYTDSSLAGLETARDVAQDVYKNDNATQEEIEAALKTLINQILEVRLLGDVNLDEVVDSADAESLLRYNAELDELSEEQLEAADVNRDEAEDSSDVVRILQYVAEIIEEF